MSNMKAPLPQCAAMVSTVADYLGAVERLSVQGIDMLEINISCPNVEHGGSRHHRVLQCDARYIH
mgnify:CR=1 FL=1